MPIYTIYTVGNRTCVLLKNIKIVKLFLVKVRFVVPFPKISLVRSEGLIKKMQIYFLIEEKYFYQNLNFFTPTVSYTLSCVTAYHFLLHIPIVCVITSFGMIIIDIIIL